MSRVEEPDFLGELREHAGGDSLELVAQLGTTSAPPRAPEGMRARLLEAAHRPGRLGHFAERVADLLDLDLAAARALLDRIDQPESWEHEGPGIDFCWVEGGPRVQGALRGFVRVEAGHAFPEHEHLGPERVLILQGAYDDPETGQRLRPGDVVERPAGTRHGLQHAPAAGVDLLWLAVVYTGVRTTAKLYLPREGDAG